MSALLRILCWKTTSACVFGRLAESIAEALRESKNAKHWSERWVDKLRSDQRNGRADVVMIVTTALADEAPRMAFIGGVWVCDFSSTLGTGCILRTVIPEAFRDAWQSRGDRSGLAVRRLSPLRTSQRNGRLQPLGVIASPVGG
jgi:Uncharacterized protein conserved in bacteria (DUF2130)